MVYHATGVVLAGGCSSRMGRDKALIQFNQQTLLSRSVQKLQELFDEVIIVTNQSSKYDHIKVKEVTDIYLGRGPLGGIHAGLQAAKSEWILVTACDMPFWKASMVDILLKARLDYDVVVPQVGNNIEPLFAIYRKSCLSAIKSCLEQNISKIIDFYSEVNVNYLDIKTLYEKEPYAFANLNTPEDLYKFLKIQSDMNLSGKEI